MVAVTLTRPEGQEDMALWTGAKDIRLTWTQSRTTSRIAGVGFITGSGLARGERLGTQISYQEY